MGTTEILSGPATPALPKTKTRNAAYWIVTGLFAALMLADGVAGVVRAPGGPEAMQHLGYPVYLLSIVGTAKILGALALVQPWLRTLKEWAYAGFTINFIGAAASWAFVDATPATVLPPVVALAVLGGAYLLYKKMQRAKAA